MSRSRAHNPSLSQLTGNYWRQATLTDFGKMHNTIDHMVGIRRLSQNHTNEQSGFKAENGYIPESKIMCQHTQDDELTV